jgi:hypothetical protein
MTTKNARLLAGAGRSLSVRGESGASVGQCGDEPIQFIFCNTYTSFAEANEAQATFIDQLIEFGVSNTKSPRRLLRTKDLRHGDLRQMTALRCGLRRTS